MDIIQKLIIASKMNKDNRLLVLLLKEVAEEILILRAKEQIAIESLLMISDDRKERLIEGLSDMKDRDAIICELTFCMEKAKSCLQQLKMLYNVDINIYRRSLGTTYSD